jgi:hypothetical protein
VKKPRPKAKKKLPKIGKVAMEILIEQAKAKPVNVPKRLRRESTCKVAPLKGTRNFKPRRVSIVQGGAPA